MPDFDWNDSRMLLAVARHGSTLTASRHLNVSQATVVRRIAALEEALKLPLVERRQSGYRLTEEALAMLDDFETLETAALRIGTLAEARRRRVAGVVRVTTHELIANLLLPAALKEFRRKYPDIAVEVMSSDRLLNLEKGEADVAIRSGPRPTEPGLVARLLAEGTWGLYGSADYIAEHGRPTTGAELAGHSLISGQGAWAAAGEAWLSQNAPDARIQLRSSSILGVISQVKQGLGLAFIPNEFMRLEPDLVWCMTPEQEISRTWLITTERLRNVARVRALLDFVVAFNNATKRSQSAEDRGQSWGV
jgi:molybdate transport repressor ModE-like protein